MGRYPYRAWTSRECLLSDPAGHATIDDFEEGFECSLEKEAEWIEQTRDISERTNDGGNLGFPRGWADRPDPEGAWQDMQLPGNWQSKGLSFSGILWFRKTIDVPSAWAGQDLCLAIGATDKSDITYFNNVPIGSVTMQDRPDAWSFPRIYTVPGEWVRPGRNIIAVRVHSDMCVGGMCGPAQAMYVACPSRPDDPRLPLAGAWRYAIEANYGLVTIPPRPLTLDNPNAPSALYNGMIEPLAPFAMRGCIWYQGESNAVQPRHYRTLLPCLIRNWRARWQQEHFHFLTVQLPNYMARPPQPSPSTWAVLREAQAMSLAMPATGMAVTIDLGLTDDIHPPNKLDVGNRLAWNACDTVYGLATGQGQAPAMKEWQIEAGVVHIVFDHTGGGLECRGETIEGFALAGTDRHFVWAAASLSPDGRGVQLSAAACPAPLAVRYAWADNPPCTLYGQQGLPVAPFRTDDWETD
ncbi:MAG: hypothetical protein HQ523_12125 [Lentisphaerae bacterium]|nr:hypothetical protein [Lentisphaerota bacterium]